MNKLFFLLLIALSVSCNMKKVSNCIFINHNDYAIQVTMITNNVAHDFGIIKSMDTLKQEYDWTALEKKDGAYQFKVKNLKTNEVVDYTDAFYTQGELTNYIEAIFAGETIQMKASN